jgi:hypothetical protein
MMDDKKISGFLIFAAFILINGCVVDFEDETPVCQAMFESGTYQINLSETSASNCDQYAGAMIASKICKGGLYCEQFNETCVCKRFE